MKKYLDHPLIKTSNSTYLSIIIILSPLLNFLGGINIDIYSPSLPSIAEFFNTSAVVVKNTIFITLFGWTLGALTFGALIDSIGRKRTLLLGLSGYVLVSFVTPWCHSIHQLMLARFIQGFMISTITVGCRALIIDTITGKRYAIAILYTSLGYGLGPIIGPFIGGVLQHYFGWQANFIALTIISATLLTLFFLFVKESIPQKQPLVVRKIIQNYLSVLSHKKFVVGGIISGITQIQLLLYPTLGPFIVEDILHYNALIYGNTALIIGISYLTGTLISRFALSYIQLKSICYLGYFFLTAGLLLAYCFNFFMEISLLTIMLPLILTCISGGLIFPTVLANNLKQFPSNAGTSMAMQASLVLFSSSIGVFIVSHIHVSGLAQLSLILSALAILQAALFFFSYRQLFD